MKPENFTAERVTRFRCEPGKQQTLFWDRKTPGLGLRVTANGAKSYIFEARLQGRTLRWTIGDVRTWAIGKAQEEATRLKTLTDQGLDPRELRAQELVKADAARAEAKRKSTLVREAWDAYLAHHQKRWGARHLADHHALAQTGGQPKKRGKGVTVDGVLRPLLDMCLGEITADVLRSWQAKEAASRANNARQGFELFRPFWRWCASQPDYAGAVDKQTVDDNDLLAEVPSRKTKRFDVLERAQLSAWFAAVRGLDNASASAYLQALLLTGARREEMAALLWADVDFRWGSLWVKDKVVEEGRKIPLTPYVASLLAALPRRNEWVFSSPTAKAGRIADPRLPHNRALSAAGLNHVTLHGLRRSFSSLAEWVEMPTGVVAQIMGHAPNATAEKHYINRPLELLAVWHGKYEAWILEQAGIKFGRPQNEIKADIESALPGALRLVGAS